MGGTMDDNKFVEWGKDPEEGMILVGFSGNAVLEGRELKNEIISLVKQKEIGFRQAVDLFKEKGQATFDQSLIVVKKIKNDLRRKDGIKIVMKNRYPYSINKVFWAHERDIPQDSRFFKLDLVDCNKVNSRDEIDTMIKENVARRNGGKKKKVFVVKEDLKENPGIERTLDAEWERK